MIFAAIDPGSVSAAIAVFHDDAPQFVDDIRTVDRQIDAAALAKALRDMKVEVVVVENVHSMPKQGVASTFKFGVAVGIIHGVVATLGLPLHLVAPTVWKKGFGLGPDKEKARGLALRYWPRLADRLALKKNVDRAEALLIGEWFNLSHRVPRAATLDLYGMPEETTTP